MKRARGRPSNPLRDALIHDAYAWLLYAGIHPKRALPLLSAMASMTAPTLLVFVEGGAVKDNERPALRGVVFRVWGARALPGGEIGSDGIERACKRYRRRQAMHGGVYDGVLAMWGFLERHVNGFARSPFRRPRGRRKARLPTELVTSDRKLTKEERAALGPRVTIRRM